MLGDVNSVLEVDDQAQRREETRDLRVVCACFATRSLEVFCVLKQATTGQTCSVKY